ncbi:MAG: hypothetical protein IK114_11550 [Fibrobacter sp.]|nr:hypothetical protein [Fibrobacter sp.]
MNDRNLLRKNGKSGFFPKSIAFCKQLFAKNELFYKTNGVTDGKEEFLAFFEWVGI